MGTVISFAAPVAQRFSIEINNDGVADYTVQTAAPCALALALAVASRRRWYPFR